MSIDFSTDRWQEIQADYASWWRGELGRPLFHISVANSRQPDRAQPSLPSVRRMAQFGDDVSADDIVDRLDWDLSRLSYEADSFPHIFTDFGAGVVAAFLGCRAQVDENTIWFHAPNDNELADMRFEFSLEHPWIQRIAEIYAAAERRWGSLVQMSMPDLGGALDILSSFRPSEKLLLDLYDCPDHVHRTVNEVHDCWWQYYEYFEGLLKQFNQGYTGWVPILSRESNYMLQSDFAYMVSPAMFEEFIRPELVACCDRLDKAFYHLDGPGELAHLDSLLAIDSLHGIQWIPGSGSPEIQHWPEVFRKIRDAGKLTQIFVGGNSEHFVDVVDILAEQTGCIDNMIFYGSVDVEYTDALDRVLRKYGAK